MLVVVLRVSGLKTEIIIYTKSGEYCNSVHKNKGMMKNINMFLHISYLDCRLLLSSIMLQTKGRVLCKGQDPGGGGVLYPCLGIGVPLRV